MRGGQQLETHTGVAFLCNVAGTASGGSIVRRDFLPGGTKQGLYAENDGGKVSPRDVQTRLRCRRCKVTLVPRENERFLSQSEPFCRARLQLKTAVCAPWAAPDCVHTSTNPLACCRGAALLYVHVTPPGCLPSPF